MWKLAGEIIAHHLGSPRLCSAWVGLREGVERCHVESVGHESSAHAALVGFNQHYTF